LGGDQQGLLQNVYRQDMTPGNRQQIVDEARIQAYAKPLLLALVLHLLCSKVRALVDLAPGAMPAGRSAVTARWRHCAAEISLRQAWRRTHWLSSTPSSISGVDPFI
jgi:hypothetical protein